MLLCLIVAAILALCKVQNLALQQVTTQWREVVGKYLTLNVVVLVLNYASWVTVKLLIMLDKILVKITHLNLYWTRHILVNARERKTTLLKEVSLLAALVNLGIYKYATEVLKLWNILCPRCAVYNKETDVLANLRSSKTNRKRSLRNYF